MNNTDVPVSSVSEPGLLKPDAAVEGIRLFDSLVTVCCSIFLDTKGFMG
ncbi:hypothetical protein [Enterocloster clostridioformis]|nr:hypothetical protein [Enterocloster clostridioformis]